MQLAHPVGVTGGQVVVHRHDVHALAGQRVQVDGQGGDEGLSFTGLHFGDPPEVQRHAAHQLDVVVALAEYASRALANHRERLDQEVVERLALGEALAEDLGLGAQLGVGQGGHLAGQLVDRSDEFGELTNPLAFTGLQDLVENTHSVTQPTGSIRNARGLRVSDLVFDPTSACGGVRAHLRQHQALRRWTRMLHRLPG